MTTVFWVVLVIGGLGAILLIVRAMFGEYDGPMDDARDEEDDYAVVVEGGWSVRAAIEFLERSGYKVYPVDRVRLVGQDNKISDHVMLSIDTKGRDKFLLDALRLIGSRIGQAILESGAAKVSTKHNEHDYSTTISAEVVIVLPPK